MSDLVSKKDVLEGINIIKAGLAMAGIGKALEAMTLGETWQGLAAIGAAEAYQDAINGIDAFAADLEDLTV